MTANGNRSDDEQAIVAIIEDMFAAISWDGESPPDLARFGAAVLPEATVVPSARPLAPTSIATFSQRMASLYVDGAMKIFDERALGTVVQVFGNIAVALGGFEAIVDDGAPGRGANAFLFVKEPEGWRIAAMAWDNEREGVQLPPGLR